MKQLLNIKETALVLKISQTTLRRLVKRKEIPFHRIGGQFFFTDENINVFLLTNYFPIKGGKNDNTK